MDLPPLLLVASSVAATLAMLLVFAAGWIASHRIGGDLPAGELLKCGSTIDDDAASRVTLADMRERLRRLEAIAIGIDL